MHSILSVLILEPANTQKVKIVSSAFFIESSSLSTTVKSSACCIFNFYVIDRNTINILINFLNLNCGYFRYKKE